MSREITVIVNVDCHVFNVYLLVSFDQAGLHHKVLKPQEFVFCIQYQCYINL